MAFDFKKITDVDMQDTVTESTNVYIEENGAIKRISANEFSGMPKLAEDGSDADKVLKANADGSGYELVEFNVAPENYYTIAAEVTMIPDGPTTITLVSGSFDDVLKDAKNGKTPTAAVRYFSDYGDGTGYYNFGTYMCWLLTDYGDSGYAEFYGYGMTNGSLPTGFMIGSDNTIEVQEEK